MWLLVVQNSFQLNHNYGTVQKPDVRIIQLAYEDIYSTRSFQREGRT